MHTHILKILEMIPNLIAKSMLLLSAKYSLSETNGIVNSLKLHLHYTCIYGVGKGFKIVLIQKMPLSFTYLYMNVRLRYLSVIALRAHESLISEHDKFVCAKCVLILLKGFIAHIFINV